MLNDRSSIFSTWCITKSKKASTTLNKEIYRASHFIELNCLLLLSRAYCCAIVKKNNIFGYRNRIGSGFAAPGGYQGSQYSF